MTDQAYWDERKAYIKAFYGLSECLNVFNIKQPQLKLILQERYQVERLCQLTNAQMYELKNWVLSNRGI